ncbi:MAG: rod shape-determining protein RodA [Mariprofundales bacterium]
MIWLFSQWRRLDIMLLLLLLLLATIGLTTLYAAVHQGDTSLWHKQIIYWGIGSIALLFIALVPMSLIAMLTWPAYIVCLIMLALIPFIGSVHMGARRWLDVGGMSLQPSEFMKWLLILALAFWFSSRVASDWQSLLMALALVLTPAGLILLQPDLGTALVLCAAGFSIVLLAGLPWQWLFYAVCAGALSAPILWQYYMHDYQKTRVLSFLDPQADPLNAGYHVIQSTIAIGSGGLFGKGYLQGTQGRLHFLPEQHTDFIFAVLAEEGGLIAVTILLLCYAALVLRILSIAERATTRFASLICVGCAAVFTLYIVVNIGMVSGLLPVVGVPMPFVSYGGSALVSMLAALGLVFRVQLETYKQQPWERPGSPLS